MLGEKFYSNIFLRLEVIGNGFLSFGDYVSLGQNVHIGVTNKVSIGNYVLVGSNVLISDHNHGKYNGINSDSPFTPPIFRELFSSGEVTIGDNVWIGDGVVILPNCKIGDGAIIGANSVVNKDIPANTIVGGNPVRIIKLYNNDTKEWERI